MSVLLLPLLREEYRLHHHFAAPTPLAVHTGWLQQRFEGVVEAALFGTCGLERAAIRIPGRLGSLLG